MCIVFIAVDRHPRYPLIIAANRDEYHARPSATMHRWRDQPGIVAGRDQRAGGTWFGVNERGRIAAVTNRRVAGLAADSAADANPNHAQSRGELTARFLRHAESMADYREFLRREHRDFSPFNLIYGDAGGLHCFSNIGGNARALGGGFHSISNGAMDEAWPKMSRGVALLQTRISSRRAKSNATPDSALAEEFAEELAQMMKDQSTAADTDHEHDHDHEKRRSSIFITGANYGTRTTTLLLGDRANFDLYEYNYHADGGESDRRQYSLAIQPAAEFDAHREHVPEKARQKA